MNRYRLGIVTPVPTSILLVILTIAANTPVTGAPVSGQGIWETSLRGRDLDGDSATFEGWYDTNLDITWLADARLIQTSGYDADGYVKWDEALDWIDSLNAGNYLGHNEWRLPIMNPIDGSAINHTNSYDGTTDRGYNMSAPGTLYAGSTASEFAHLFYITLGNISYYDFDGNPGQPGYGMTNTGPFQNMEETGYWIDLEYALDPTGAWKFHFKWGYQDPDPKFVTNYTAWAVHPGDIGAPPRGDINTDGQVNAADVWLAQRYILKMTTLTAAQIAHGDVYPATGDGLLTFADTLIILANALGLNSP